MIDDLFGVLLYVGKNERRNCSLLAGVFDGPNFGANHLSFLALKKNGKEDLSDDARGIGGV